MQMHHKQQSRGAALISALFITAIAAVLATAMAVHERLLIFHSELLINSDKIYLALQGVQDWAISDIQQYEKLVLNKKLKTSSQLQMAFSKRIFQGVALNGRVIDQQGLFNINRLVNSSNQPQFVRLLQLVDPQLTGPQAFTLAKSVTAWMTPGSKNDVYLHANPPYLASHREMMNVSELRLVNGFNARLFRALQPWLTAIPIGNKNVGININTVSVPVLYAIDTNLSLNAAKDIIACRTSHGAFFDINNFQTLCLKPQGIAPIKGLTTASQYFMVSAQAKLGSSNAILKSFLVANLQKNNTISVRIAWQSVN